jgi:hypothetical protein
MELMQGIKQKQDVYDGKRGAKNVDTGVTTHRESLHNQVLKKVTPIVSKIDIIVEYCFYRNI